MLLENADTDIMALSSLGQTHNILIDSSVIIPNQVCDFNFCLNYSENGSRNNNMGKQFLASWKSVK